MQKKFFASQFSEQGVTQLGPLVAVGVYTAAGLAGSDPVGAAPAPGGGAAAGGAVNFPDLMGLGLVAAFYVLERRREVERVHVQSVV